MMEGVMGNDWHFFMSVCFSFHCYLSFKVFHPHMDHLIIFMLSLPPVFRHPTSYIWLQKLRKLCHAVSALYTGCQPIGWCLSAVWNSLWRKSITCLDVSCCLQDWCLAFILWAAIESSWGILDEMVSKVKHNGELQWTLRGRLKDPGDWSRVNDVWETEHSVWKDWDKLCIKSMNDMMAHHTRMMVDPQ